MIPLLSSPRSLQSENPFPLTIDETKGVDTSVHSEHSLGPEVICSQLGVVNLHHQPGVLRLAAQDLEDTEHCTMSLVVFNPQQSPLIHLYKEQNEKSQWTL